MQKNWGGFSPPSPPLSTSLLCRVDITIKWLPHRLVQTKTHDISFILSAGLTTVLIWNQRHRRGRLAQDGLKIYRRSYHPPNLNVPETLYSFKFLFFVSSTCSAVQTLARAFDYNFIIIILIMCIADHVINLNRD